MLIVLTMANEELTKTIAYIVLLSYLHRHGLDDLQTCHREQKKYAWSQCSESCWRRCAWRGSKNPSQFDEPDEDALEEMADLLGENDD